MNAATDRKTLAGRMVLFLALPVALWWGLEFVIPLSRLIARDLFFPFVSHPRALNEGFSMYFANGAFVTVVAIVTVIAGRRFSILANVGIFLGTAIALSLLAHVILGLLGFPFQGDSP